MGNTPNRPLGRRTRSYKNGCSTGKNTYEQKSDAKYAISHMDRRKGRLKAYRCVECREFHLTSMTYMEQVEHGLIEADK